MLNIFVVLSCEMVGSARDPDTPRIVTPELMLLAVILDCSVELIATVPPVVYPAGIVTVPALVLIVPLVEPLFAIDPETDPDAPNAVLPVSMSAPVTSALVVS